MFFSVLGPIDLAAVVVAAVVFIVGLKSRGKSIKVKLGQMEATINEVKTDVRSVERSTNGRPPYASTMSQDVASTMNDLADLRAQHVELSEYIHEWFHEMANVMTVTKAKADTMWTERLQEAEQELRDQERPPT